MYEQRLKGSGCRFNSQDLGIDTLSRSPNQQMYFHINPRDCCGICGLSEKRLVHPTMHGRGSCSRWASLWRSGMMQGALEHSPVRIHRVVRRHSDWTLNEHEVVIEHWPDIEKIRRRLPHRTRRAIQYFADRCNLRTRRHVWTQREVSILKKRVREGVPRKDIAEELRLSLCQVASYMQHSGVRYDRRAPQTTGNLLMDAIFQRASQLNMSKKDLDELCRSGRAFSGWSPSRSIHNRHLWRAVKELDGRFVVEWSAL